MEEMHDILIKTLCVLLFLLIGFILYAIVYDIPVNETKVTENVYVYDKYTSFHKTISYIIDVEGEDTGNNMTFCIDCSKYDSLKNNQKINVTYKYFTYKNNRHATKLLSIN
ncbi:hypothetical protein C4D27_11245 [Clostridium perfringens]|uniref:hypothetical protein n=1 Tax=Clostridium perfringens TaxID=1502 RepID=UPI0039E78005